MTVSVQVRLALLILILTRADHSVAVAVCSFMCTFFF